MTVTAGFPKSGTHPLCSGQLLWWTVVEARHLNATPHEDVFHAYGCTSGDSMSNSKKIFRMPCTVQGALHIILSSRMMRESLGPDALPPYFQRLPWFHLSETSGISKFLCRPEGLHNVTLMLKCTPHQKNPCPNATFLLYCKQITFHSNHKFVYSLWLHRHRPENVGEHANQTLESSPCPTPIIHPMTSFSLMPMPTALG